MASHTVRPHPASDLTIGPYRVRFAFGADDRVDEYRLRYQVFVEERQFESADRCPDGLEQDEFDAASCALLLEDQETGASAACQRLILPDRLPPGTLTNFEREYRPIETAPCAGGFDVPRHVWAEVSRTTVAREYRWGNGRITFPAMLAIKYGSIALAIAFGRSTLFSLSDARTARLIRRLSFPIVQVGAPVEFHGARVPFRMDVSEMFRSVRPADRAAVDDLIRGALSCAAAARHA